MVGILKTDISIYSIKNTEVGAHDRDKAQLSFTPCISFIMSVTWCFSICVLCFEHPLIIEEKVNLSGNYFPHLNSDELCI